VTTATRSLASAAGVARVRVGTTSSVRHTRSGIEASAASNSSRRPRETPDRAPLPRASGGRHRRRRRPWAAEFAGPDRLAGAHIGHLRLGRPGRDARFHGDQEFHVVRLLGSGRPRPATAGPRLRVQRVGGDASTYARGWGTASWQSSSSGRDPGDSGDPASRAEVAAPCARSSGHVGAGRVERRGRGRDVADEPAQPRCR